MRTVKELIIELQKFPEGALCWAYEGEETGISVKFLMKSGFIPCEFLKEDGETEVFGKD